MILWSAGPASAQEFLDEAAIKTTFAGNTITFPDYKTKKPIFIYLKEDGGFDMKFQGQSRNGKWWIGKDATFCREYTGGSRRSCSKASLDGNMVSFFRRGKKFYEAELLSGNQLP